MINAGTTRTETSFFAANSADLFSILFRRIFDKIFVVQFRSVISLQFLTFVKSFILKPSSRLAGMDSEFHSLTKRGWSLTANKELSVLKSSARMLLARDLLDLRISIAVWISDTLEISVLIRKVRVRLLGKVETIETLTYICSKCSTQRIFHRRMRAFSLDVQHRFVGTSKSRFV